MEVHQSQLPNQRLHLFEYVVLCHKVTSVAVWAARRVTRLPVLLKLPAVIEASSGWMAAVDKRYSRQPCLNSLHGTSRKACEQTKSKLQPGGVPIPAISPRSLIANALVSFRPV